MRLKYILCMGVACMTGCAGMHARPTWEVAVSFQYDDQMSKTEKGVAKVEVKLKSNPGSTPEGVKTTPTPPKT